MKYLQFDSIKMIKYIRNSFSILKKIDKKNGKY